jgi:hypothetical protein
MRMTTRAVEYDLLHTRTVTDTHDAVFGDDLWDLADGFFDADNVPRMRVEESQKSKQWIHVTRPKSLRDRCDESMKTTSLLAGDIARCAFIGSDCQVTWRLGGFSYSALRTFRPDTRDKRFRH